MYGFINFVERILVVVLLSLIRPMERNLAILLTVYVSIPHSYVMIHRHI